jgi:hypothetical protein
MARDGGLELGVVDGVAGVYSVGVIIVDIAVEVVVVVGLVVLVEVVVVAVTGRSGTP